MKRIINSIIVIVFTGLLFIGTLYLEPAKVDNNTETEYISSENWIADEENPIEIEDFELSKYVKLGEIDGIELDVPYTEVDDDYVRQQINEMLTEYPEERTYDTLDDAFVKQYFELDTVQDLFDSVKDYCTVQAENDKSNTAFEMFVQNALALCDITVPKELLNYKTMLYLSKLKKNIEANGLTVKDYVENYYGETEEEFFKTVTSMIEESLKKQMMLTSYAKENAIELDEEAYESYKESFIQYYGYENDEALYKDYSKSELRNSCLCNQVVEMLLDVIKINYVPNNTNTEE